jgi:Putative zinc-finger
VTSAGDCAETRRALGVYIVGAIAPAERSAVDGHLADCARCRAELAGLAGLPALLGRVPADEARRLLVGDDTDTEIQPQLPLQSLLGRAARLRQHRKWPRLAAAAAVGLAAGGGVIAASHVLDKLSPQPPAAAVQQWARTVQASNPATRASTMIRYQSQPWGLQVAVQISGIPVGTRCELQVVDASGHEVASGSWTVTAGHQGAWYSASSSVHLSGLRGFVITGGPQTLVTVPVR